MSDPFDGLEPRLVPLGQATIRFRDTLVLPDTPEGTRLIVEIASVDLIGDRLRASLAGSAGADWVRVSPDGKTGLVDVRATLRTEDGALIYTEYHGRVRFGSGTTHEVRAAPRFSTGDPRHAWLNAVQAVAIGRSDAAARTLHYRLYELA